MHERALRLFGLMEHGRLLVAHEKLPQFHGGRVRSF